MNTIIPHGPTYSDERGQILMILEDVELHSVSIISSRADSTRACHWHKKDSHYCIVNAGEIWYYERPVGSNEKPTLTVINQGELFYTAPMTEHQMYFPVDTVFSCYSTLSRKTNDYEADTARLTENLKDIYDKV